jgi:hypothetical protein
MAMTSLLAGKMRTRRLLLLALGAWLSLAVLPCFAAPAGCAMPDDGAPCPMTLTQSCESATLDCAVPPAQAATTPTIDVPPFTADAVAIVPMIPTLAATPPRQWQRSSLQIPSAAHHHLQHVRLLI